jgi:formylglycine-generating enzyme required for sulfatase activity
MREAIFIGYRRDDTADVAGRIYDALAQRFGRGRLFKDVDSLRPGADFGRHIQTLLPRCRVVLVLIGPKWLDARDEKGRRRLDDPNDWVRIEIEIALGTTGLDVVPVLVNGAEMPRAEDLPESLHPLLRRHAAVIRRDPDFQGDIAKLAIALGASVKTGILDLAGLGGERTTAAAGAARSTPRWPLVVGAFSLLLIALFSWPMLQQYLNTQTPGVGASVAPSDGGNLPDTSQRQSSAANGGAEPAQTSSARVSGEFDDCGGAGWCPTMVVIPGGNFLMGRREGEWGLESGLPQHSVTIRRFAVGKFEVTFDQWEACANRGGCTTNRVPGDTGFGRGNHPVINVSWRDAQEYVRWLNFQTNQNYRLLTEAEWEYAARAGTTTLYYTGENIDVSQARFNNQSSAPVGSYPPNPFGLYDMAGNVAEWVEDCASESYIGAPSDGSAVVTGRCYIRRLRGGSWSDTNRGALLASFRNADSPDTSGASYGFRVARAL